MTLLLKSDLRETFLSKRKSLKLANKDICFILANAEKIINQHNPQKIAAYTKSGSELDLTSLIQSLEEKGHEILLPVCNRKTMSFYNKENVQGNGFKAKAIDTANSQIPDIAIIPSITCDRLGNRIGYGQGFYDKYLSAHKSIITLSLVPEELICKNDFAVEKHDVHVNYIVSQKLTYSNF
ncbi:MAG: 5-formyltetrahydrofolate cyclo-ligase [Rickettsiales bacterium]